MFPSGLTYIDTISVPFYDLSNSLTAVKRQEKELNIFEDFPENSSDVQINQPDGILGKRETLDDACLIVICHLKLYKIGVF